jgi:D-alanyl-D-alanine carboxypeptidase
VTGAVLVGGAAHASTGREELRARMTEALQEYLAERREPEMISGVSAFVSLRDGETGVSAVAGTTSRSGPREPVTRRTLYEIGSNTKSFTAALLLQLEAEGRLDIDQTVGDWLPQYPAWADVSIRRLLNMTSGIPTYSEAPAFMKLQARHPQHHFTPEQLVAYAYPSGKHRLPVDEGWFYSNTDYVLAGMIAEKASGKSYARLLKERIFEPLFMRDSFFDPWALPESVIRRMSSGYFDNPVCGEYEPDCKVGPLQPLVGMDMRRADLSWTGAAGGIVSTPRDLQRWVRGVFGGRVLPKRQLAEMLELVSTETGEPIEETTADDPRGFSLGFAQMFHPTLGRFWMYEGITLGYRTIFAWFPEEDLVVTVSANSQPREGEDRLGGLAARLHDIAFSASPGKSGFVGTPSFD